MHNDSCRNLILIIFIIFSLSLLGQDQTSGNLKSKSISKDLFGIFFEDINYAADGGLYAELIQNRSFEYSPTDRTEWNPFTSWEYVTTGFSYGSIQIETNEPIHSNNPHYIHLQIEHIGSLQIKSAPQNAKIGYNLASVGIKNNGYDFITVHAGDEFNFSFFAKNKKSEHLPFLIRLQDNKGNVLAENTLTVDRKEWKKYNSRLKSNARSDSCSLLILATNEGDVLLDMISLFPQHTFMNRQNGMRSDLARIIAELKPSFVRFPGGCLAHGDGVGNMYRWKNTIGPLETRKEQKNIWGYHQSLGLGYFEYFQFCEDIHAKPLPVVPAGVSCQNSGGTWRIGSNGQCAIPMKDMKEYVQEILDLVEWANGSDNTKWGSIRAAAGHPNPFNLEYIAIGNEDHITPEFSERFKMIYKAVKTKYPYIKLIGTAGPFSDGEDFEKGWRIADSVQADLVDEHYYKDPEWLLKNLNRYHPYDRTKSKIYLGEYASWGNKQLNAIAEAAFMIGLEQNGDVVSFASYAPLLAKKDHTQWKTDMIFFDNTSYYLTPNYYVQKMFSIHKGDVFIQNIFFTDHPDSTIITSCVKDSHSGDIIFKIVNTGPQDKSLQIPLSLIPDLENFGELTVLSAADAEAVNSFSNPYMIKPTSEKISMNPNFYLTMKPYSLSILRIQSRQKTK